METLKPCVGRISQPSEAQKRALGSAVILISLRHWQDPEVLGAADVAVAFQFESAKTCTSLVQGRTCVCLLSTVYLQTFR